MPPHMLIVEDKEANRKAYRMAFEESGLSVDINVAANESEALKLIIEAAEPFDVVVTDLVMASDQGGIDVLRAARERDPLAIVIVFTAFENILDRYKAFEMGAFDCIEKGVPGVRTAQELIAKVRTAISFRGMITRALNGERKLAFLSRYFDKRVYELIDKNPELLNIQNRTVTTVFWDIRGFSKISEDLKQHPSLIAAFLREYFDLAVNAIFEHGGVLDKFIGDGVLAIFGAFPVSDKENGDAGAAVSAALRLRDSFDALASTWLEQWQLYTPVAIDIGLGCGMHTGESLVGNVGTDRRDQFTALGPHVNFSQRIEARALKGQILISASTKARVAKLFEFKEVGTIDDIKNIPGKFAIFDVLRAKPS